MTESRVLLHKQPDWTKVKGVNYVWENALELNVTAPPQFLQGTIRNLFFQKKRRNVSGQCQDKDVDKFKTWRHKVFPKKRKCVRSVSR